VARFRYTSQALKDLKDYKKAHNKTALVTIKDIQCEIAKNPFALTGKYNPERLKGNRSGWYSRRINRCDRFVYRPLSGGTVIDVAQCKGHYDDK